MILYHSSNVKIEEIDLTRCHPYEDFGQGFYLTDIQEQAAQMTRRVVKLYGGKPYVSVFNFDESTLDSKDIKTLSFEKPDKDWALFVLNNRDKRFKDISDVLCNQDNKYDLIYGPVANDDIAYLFRTFTNGLIDIDVLISGLKYKTLTTQYSFHTEKALKFLHLEG